MGTCAAAKHLFMVLTVTLTEGSAKNKSIVQVPQCPIDAQVHSRFRDTQGNLDENVRVPCELIRAVTKAVSTRWKEDPT